MKLSLVSRLGFGLILLLALNHYVQSAPSSGSTKEAYVTLLYGDEFVLGVRVLGKSIRDTRTARDMVVLVSDGVSNYAKKLLKADGWIVTPISLLENPNQVRPTRFWGVYTKLKIFNMTDYKKVVYLDADTIVVKNIDDLFKCGKFCANLKHSERLNSGVMVVEPSEELFKDMVSKVTTLYSYTGGDQGFLNTYYAGFASARVFDPEISPEILNSKPVPEMERLSTLYNADVGLYMLANKWMVDEKELRVIHYTLGPLKPWDWWTSWLLKPILDKLYPHHLNLDLFPRLVQTRSLCDHARHIYYKFRSGGSLSYSAVSSSTINSSQQVPAFLGGVSIFFCFMAAVVALGLGVSVVPRQVKPWTGLLLMYEWTFTVFFLLFGGHQRQVSCDAATWYYGLGMAFLAIATPSIPCIFGITALFSRVVEQWMYGLWRRASRRGGDEELLSNELGLLLGGVDQ
ncbi:Glycosyl transferase, family 8, partial [Cynara cardunculus var. scolymus]